MSGSKLNRLKGLSSAQTTKQDESVEIAGFADLVKQLEQMTAASLASNQALAQSLQTLTQTVSMATKDGIDLSGVTAAINDLKTKMSEKKTIKMPQDYVIHFERDKYNLMKSGIRLTSVDKKLN